MSNKTKKILIGLGIVVIVVVSTVALKVSNLGAANISTANNEINFYTASLITNDIDGWSFIETSQKTDGNGVSVHTAYYSKELSPYYSNGVLNSRVASLEVDIYEFDSQVSAKNEIDKWSKLKGYSYVKEKVSNVVILESIHGDVWWTSNNLLVKMHSGTSGAYLDAYDLAVCCNYSGREYQVHASKAVFDAYIEKYPVN